MSAGTDVTDFRLVLEEKLSTKRDELGQTEQNLKKFVASGNGLSQGQGRASNLFRNRLGPAVQGQDKRRLLGNRLGPKVSGDAGKVRNEGDAGQGQVRSILSRVVVEQKSREEALAHQQKTTDKKEVMRNKRMFGSIMGTLQTFVRDENRGKEREMRKREIEKKIEKRTEQEKAEAVKEKHELFEEKRRKVREIKALQLQMRRVEEFEAWENSKRRQLGFIRTKTANSNPIYYLPKQHNDATMDLLKETTQSLEEEIKQARESFEDELLRINSKIDNPQADLEEASDDEDDDEAGLKQLSVVSAIAKPATKANIEPEKTVDRGKSSTPALDKDKDKDKDKLDKSVKKETDEKKTSTKRKRSTSSQNDSSTDSSSDSSSASDASKKGKKKSKRPRKRSPSSESD